MQEESAGIGSIRFEERLFDTGCLIDALQIEQGLGETLAWYKEAGWLRY